MWFLWSLLAALAAFSAAAIEDDVLLRAEAAASACTAPGGAPHPWDPQLLVLCADARVPLTVVHCPPGTMASNATRGCQPTSASDDGPLPAHRRWRLRRQGPDDVSRICKDGAGIYCDGCDTMVVCSVNAAKQMSIVAKTTCSSSGDMSCDPATRSCKAGSSCTSGAGSSFRCLVPGLFPDPDDCKRYHLCDDELQDFSDTCDLGYDATKEECARDNEKEKAKECDNTNPLKKCAEGNSDTKAFSPASSFYRICFPRSPKGFTTSVMRCPVDQSFDSTKGACTYKCSGPTKRYADPVNCHNYYDCVAGTSGAEAKLELKTCPKGLAFDTTKLLCLQEAKVEACSSPPTTTPAPITTTTTPAPVATPSTTTTTKAPTTTTSQGDCTEEGSTMPDPSNSSRYYVCTRSGGRLVKKLQYCLAMANYNKGLGYCTFFWG